VEKRRSGEEEKWRRGVKIIKKPPYLSSRKKR